MTDTTTPKGHYLLVVLPDGKSAVRREYLQLEREDETLDEATERWILQHPSMVNRQRNRDKTANNLRAQILEVRFCRPSSWYRENKLGAHAEPGATTTKTRRRAA